MTILPNRRPTLSSELLTPRRDSRRVAANATKEMGEAARASSWARWVSDWFFSAEVGLAKPNEELYKRVTASLQVAPATCTTWRTCNVALMSRRAWAGRLTAGPPTRTESGGCERTECSLATADRTI